MKVYISAPSGVGKTTATNELAHRGYPAFDTDYIPGLARLEIGETGQPAEWPTSGYVDWKKYAWNIQPMLLNTLLVENKILFLSGICGNQQQFYNKFDKLIVLTVGPEEYLRRMKTRPYRGANDDEINIQQRVRKYATKIQQFIDDGFTPIDNSGPVQNTVDEILNIIYEN